MSAATEGEWVAVIERYERFARLEAPGRSALYGAWAETVRDDAGVARVLAQIPDTHRQPPLVFAVSRMLGAPEDPPTAWGAWVLAHADALVAECRIRSIQTNEPLRCAALLPALDLIDGPIALLEVGASAGLCLYPDRFSYRYRMPDGHVHAIDPVSGPSTVTLESTWIGGEPPTGLPEIVWRAGIDLAPLDVRRPADRAWLTDLVWPGETGRRERIDAAADIAAADPPHLETADATDADALAALAASAPAGATLVVTTPGVLAHVPGRRRHAAIAAARGAGRWVTLDAPALHNGWTTPIDAASWPASRFALALDGEVLAAVDPLGASVEWRRGIDADRG
ncbi:DUF2332 domain-containing protein [Microbacterium sp. cx-55]|uniref:DUF2332 family protein n=1 Tax=Microbacterium sp. cx-55 TaxID=2875948 RepID=UPI001CBD21C0|nr:DUF2332 family protein [Microbacterium sp. cx-55]MBZ4488155.1 DUF2332 domain-containing protein [Microbacterium sp. cx-55]UGB34436.1 DUF2332 domain-containing protein [Microbacterium sp. cx-55]